MPEQHADVLKVLNGQMAKCCETNPVFSKALRVLGHAELFEPVGNLLHRGPFGFNAIRSGPTERKSTTCADLLQCSPKPRRFDFDGLHSGKYDEVRLY